MRDGARRLQLAVHLEFLLEDVDTLRRGGDHILVFLRTLLREAVCRAHVDAGLLRLGGGERQFRRVKLDQFLAAIQLGEDVALVAILALDDIDRGDLVRRDHGHEQRARGEESLAQELAMQRVFAHRGRLDLEGDV